MRRSGKRPQKLQSSYYLKRRWRSRRSSREDKLAKFLVMSLAEAKADVSKVIAERLPAMTTRLIGRTNSGTLVLPKTIAPSGLQPLHRERILCRQVLAHRRWPSSSMPGQMEAPPSPSSAGHATGPETALRVRDRPPWPAPAPVRDHRPRRR